MSQKFLDLAGLTAYDKMLKEWFKNGVVDITDDAINALFAIQTDGPWVTFTAEEDGSSISLVSLSTNQTLEYSTDTTTWNTFDTSTNISLNNGDKVYVRGMLSANNEVWTNFTHFEMSGKIAASGNCNAIWNYQDLNAPLKRKCGSNMFQGCTSLTTAPELPATELASECYGAMFSGCTSLTTIPELPATTLAPYCYSGMFRMCSSLTVAPKLPATELANRCYQNMFKECTSLTTSPELPTTELVEGCYGSMFEGCSSLIVAPELPATKLVDYCYQNMFRSCINLNYIKCLATDIPSIDCTYDWVDGVSNSGTFVKHPDTTDAIWWTSTSSIPEGWTVVDAEV